MQVLLKEQEGEFLSDEQPLLDIVYQYLVSLSMLHRQKSDLDGESQASSAQETDDEDSDEVTCNMK